MVLSEVVVVVQLPPVVVVVVLAAAAALVTQLAKLVALVALEGQATSLEQQCFMLPVAVVVSMVTLAHFREVFLVLVVPVSAGTVEAKHPTALTEMVAQRLLIQSAVGVFQVLQTLDPVVVVHQTHNWAVTVVPVLSLFVMHLPAKARSVSALQPPLLMLTRP
jgi:hypothetical protein